MKVILMQSAPKNVLFWIGTIGLVVGGVLVGWAWQAVRSVSQWAMSLERLE